MTKKEYDRSYHRKYDKSPVGIWSHLGHNSTGKKKERKISKEDFIKWYVIQKKQCIYCGIKEKDLKNDWRIKTKGVRLEIDRKDNNQPYILGNLSLACRYCNITKSDIFNYQEMRIIGKILNKKEVAFILMRKKKRPNL